MEVNQDIDPVATVFSGGMRYLLGRSGSKKPSYFGGPGYDMVIEGPRYGPRRVHHILTLSHGAHGIRATGFKTSFYYGLCFDGCRLEWQRKATAAIQITRIEPRKSARDFPYFGYPDLLPYFPLETKHQSAASADDIKQAIYNTSWNIDSSKVYVIAHSHPELGIALLTPESDVDLVFEYDTSTGRIRATNQCS